MTDVAVEVQTEVVGAMHRRELLVDGHTVSRLVVHDRRFWLLGTQVGMGGIGGVGTDRAHRRKGYSRRLMEDTLDYMAGLGQEISMLFGIPDFYDRFGYTPFMPEPTVRVATRDAERFAHKAADHTVRPARAEDRPFIVDLYNRDSRLRPGPLVREPDEWRGFGMGSNYDRRAIVLVLEAPDGSPVGYVVLDEAPTDVTAIEANATEPGLFPPLLHELTTLAVERRCEHIQLHAPPDHAFARFMTRCGCQVTTNYHRMAGGMMRLIDQDALFARLAPALAARVKRSPFGASRVVLHIETDLGTSDLQLGTGRERVEAQVALPQQRLVQLMMGYRNAADVLSEPDVESGGEGSALLDLLFGGRNPYVWRADRF